MNKDDLLAGLQAAEAHLKKADAEIHAKLNTEREIARPLGVESVVGVGSLSAASSVTMIDGNRVTVSAGVLVKR